MNPENGKKTYESIDIPKNLNETVMQTIASKKKEELKMKYESNENNVTKPSVSKKESDQFLSIKINSTENSTPLHER